MNKQIFKILMFTIIFLSTMQINHSALAFSGIISSSDSDAGMSRDVNEVSLADCLGYFIKNGYLQDYTVRRLFSINKYNSTRPESDKLYIGMQLNDSFHLKINKNEKKARFVIFDYENKEITDFGFSEPGFYLSNISDTIVYQALSNKQPKVIILHKNENGTVVKREIENAFFPSLSNKRELCYSKITGYTNDDLPKTKLIRQKLDSGKIETVDTVIPYFIGNKEINLTPDIGIFMSDFSPFGGLSFVSYTISGGIFKVSIMIYSDIAAHQMLHDDIGPMSLFPYNCSGNLTGIDLIFQSRKTFSGNNYGNAKYLNANSPEITSYTNFENFQSQMTSNNIAEWHARIWKNGCFYIESPGGNLLYKNREFSNIKPLYFEIWDNLFVYAAQREDSKGADIKIVRIYDSSSISREIEVNITESIQRLLGSD